MATYENGRPASSLLGLWIAVVCMASCSAADEVPGPKVDHPDERRVPAPTASPATTAASPPPHGPGPSPLDRAIALDWPPRPWSKNVPDRACKNDGECGDGFCDRGQCASIWTWTQIYGQRCDAIHLFHSGSCPASASSPTEPKCDQMPLCAGGYLCIDGRCRSCVSNAECFNGGGVCSPAGSRPTGRACGIPGPPDPPPRF